MWSHQFSGKCSLTRVKEENERGLSLPHELQVKIFCFTYQLSVLKSDRTGFSVRSPHLSIIYMALDKLHKLLESHSSSLLNWVESESICPQVLSDSLQFHGL